MPIVIRMAHIASKTKVAVIRMTAEQLRLIDARAKRCGVRTSVWMRSILLQAANTEPARFGRGDGYLRIREPDGVTT